MKRKKLSFVMIFMMTVMSFEVHAQDNMPRLGIYINWDYEHAQRHENFYFYMFLENNIIEYFSNFVTKERSGVYTVDESSGVPFINILWDNNATERFLMLIAEDFLLFYNGDSTPIFFGLFYDSFSWNIREGFGQVNKLERQSLIPREFQNVTASNSLIEGGINYSPTPGRLGLQINRAWAVRGGVGESLFGQAGWYYYYDGILNDQHLYISIGYVAHSRPNLYFENSRPKKIRIYDINDRSIFHDFDLLDTPNFQLIDVSKFTRNPTRDRRSGDWERYSYHVSIRIEILEIYPGTRYNDTCINSILFLHGDYK